MNLSDTSIRWINSEPASNTSQPNKSVTEGSVPFTTTFAKQFKTFSLRQPNAESGKVLPQSALETDASRIVPGEPGLNEILVSSRLSETLKSTGVLKELNKHDSPAVANKNSGPEAMSITSTPEILKTSARLEAPNVSSAPKAANSSLTSEVNQTLASMPSSILLQSSDDGNDQTPTTSIIPAATVERNAPLNEMSLQQEALAPAPTPTPTPTPAPAPTPAPTPAPATTASVTATFATTASETKAPLAPTGAGTPAQVTAAPVATAPVTAASLVVQTPVTTTQATAAPSTTIPVTTATTNPAATTEMNASLNETDLRQSALASSSATTAPVTEAPVQAAVATPTALLTATPATKASETTGPLAPTAPVTTAQTQIPATQAQRRFAYHAQNPVANTAEPITPKAFDTSLPRAEIAAPTQNLNARTATTATEVGPATTIAPNTIKSAELSAVIERAQPATTIAPNTTKSAELSAVIERIEPTVKTSTPVQISSVAIDLAVAQWTKARMNSQSDSRAESSEIVALSAPQDRAVTEPLALRTPRTETDTSALSQRFAEQLGQRLTREITNTPWRAELELHPKSLGRIDIQLDFVNGQLEGHFQSNNALTRELLQDGLPKLRELLQQNGHTTVQLDVGSGSTSSNNERGSAHANNNGTEPKIRITQGDESPDQQPIQTGTTEGFDLFV